MKDKKDSAQFMQGKGFYVALALIVAGAAIASFIAVSDMLQSITATPEEINSNAGQEDVPWTQPTRETETKQPNVPVSSAPVSQGQSGSSSAVPSSQPSQPSTAPAAAPASPTASYTSPLAGTTLLQMYSGDELVYNKTMGDWRTHNGVDLAGKQQQAVLSPLTGEVGDVYADALWGTVVELTQAPYTVRLCGLESTQLAKGDHVKTGQTLGLLGTIAAESALEPHLHVEIEKDGALIDPATLLNAA